MTCGFPLRRRRLPCDPVRVGVLQAVAESGPLRAGEIAERLDALPSSIRLITDWAQAGPTQQQRASKRRSGGFGWSRA